MMAVQCFFLYCLYYDFAFGFISILMLVFYGKIFIEILKTADFFS
jgi:hypothetical protein